MVSINPLSPSGFSQEEEPNFLKLKDLTPEENDWVNKTIELVKSSKSNSNTKKIEIQAIMSALQSFDSSHFLTIVDVFLQNLRKNQSNKMILDLNNEIVKLVHMKNVDDDVEEKQDKYPSITALLASEEIRKETSLVDVIKKYHIDKTTTTGQEILIEIAKLCAQKNGKKTSKNIKNFDIDPKTEEGLKALIEIAKLCAQQNGWGTAENIKNFGIDPKTDEGQKALVEIAKLCAQQSGWGTSYNIKNFDIDPTKEEGLKALIEIAKLCVQENAWRTAENIKNFGIDPTKEEGQKGLIEIAKLCTQQKNGEDTSMYIQNFGIDPEAEKGMSELIEIAKLCAKQNGFLTASKIKNFGINPKTEKGLKGLIEIAKLCAQQKGWGTSQNIKNFGIDPKTEEGLKALIEIAKLCAQQDGQKTSENIKNFGIDPSTVEGQKALIEIAKICAQQNGWGTSENIKNFGIDPTEEGQKALIEIAKICAQRSGSQTAENIRNFGIDPKTEKGQKALIKIAKLCAQQNGWGTAENIKNFGIDLKTEKGQKALIEIAKLCAQQSGSGTAEKIKNFGIDPKTKEAQKALIEIAQLCMQQSSYRTAKNIQNFGIDPKTEEAQKALIEIAKFCTKHNSLETVKFFQNFGITDSQVLNDFKTIFFNSILFQMKSLSNLTNFEYLDLKHKNGISHLSTEAAGFLSALKSLDTPVAMEKCIQLCSEKFQLSKEKFDWLKEAFEGKEPFVQKRLVHWFIDVAALCSMKEDLSEVLANSTLLKEISKRDPRLRERLSKELIALYYNRQQDQWKALRNQDKEKLVHIELARLIFARFINEEQNISQALSVLKNERVTFREGKNQKLLLETLLAIKDSSLKEKADFISALFKEGQPTEKRLKILTLVRDLIAFNGEEYLKDLDIKGLQNSLSQLFQEKFQVQIEDFGTKYEETVGKWRRKEALITYAGKLNKLVSPEKEQVIEYLKQIISSVLDKKFSDIRYDTKNNPHLEEISKKNPKIMGLWRTSLELAPSEIEGPLNKIEDTSTKKTILPMDLVKNNVKTALENKHLGGIQYATLYPNLAEFTKNPDQINVCLEKVNLVMLSLSGQKLTKEENQQRQTLLMEKRILELFTITDTEIIQKNISDLRSLIPKNAEFYKDMEDCLKLLTQKETRPQTYKVVDSDDPNDFLLMGTEVLNSCQAVDGDVQYNKCLLGYFLDGKHRLLLIKDAENKIVARSIVRLLIDKTGQPVLFQERMYVADTNPSYAGLLRQLAIKKAHQMSIPLVVSKSDFEKETASPYPTAIYAKEKPVPFEYVDAKDGIQSGPYSIPDALQII